MLRKTNVVIQMYLQQNLLASSLISNIILLGVIQLRYDLNRLYENLFLKIQYLFDNLRRRCLKCLEFKRRFSNLSDL